MALLAAVAVVPAIAIAGQTSARPTAPAPAAAPAVFAESRSLAIEAARARLALFVEAHPQTPPGAPTDPPECPLASADTMASVASTISGQSAVDLRLQLDPWLGRTTSDPELRPDSTPAGQVGAIPIVRCDTSRPTDAAITRPGVQAISLVDGVSFNDVVQLYNLSGLLRTQPAGIGGSMVGSCLATADTSVCVVLWQSRNLTLGLTLEGPPGAVNTTTAGATLTVAVPQIVDSLAVVLGPAPECSIEAIRADTGVTLLAEPSCDDGWASGTSVECPPPTTLPPETTEAPIAFARAVPPATEFCEALDVFHIEPSGWVHNGSIDLGCTESLTRLGMTVATASEIAATPCDQNDPSLATGSIRPGQEGTRVAALQIALVNLGYDLPVDARYGPLTEAAVVDYQVRNGLIVDGIAGPQTQGSLGI